jgi:hypothetical protein
VSLSPATALIVNGITLTPPPAGPTAAAGPVLSLFGTTFIAANGGPEFIIAGQTLTPGGTIAVQGTTLSLAPTPTAIFINGAPQPVATITQAPAITIDGTAVPLLPGGSFIIGTQTLRPGQTITVSGTTALFDAAMAYVVLNGATTTLLPATAGLPYLVLAGTTYPATALPRGAYLIAGQLLLPGHAITVSGTTLSLANPPTALVVDGRTMTLAGFLTAPFAASAVATSSSTSTAAELHPTPSATKTKKAAAAAVYGERERALALLAVAVALAWPLLGVCR